MNLKILKTTWGHQISKDFFKNDLNNFGKDLIKEISCKMKNSSDNISYFKENIITQNINQSNLETNLNEKILSLSSIEKIIFLLHLLFVGGID